MKKIINTPLWHKFCIVWDLSCIVYFLVTKWVITVPRLIAALVVLGFMLQHIYLLTHSKEK